MCKSIEATVTMVNYGVEFAKETGKEEFYMNYVKLHNAIRKQICGILAICFGYCGQCISAYWC